MARVAVWTVGYVVQPEPAFRTLRVRDVGSLLSEQAGRDLELLHIFLFP